MDPTSIRIRGTEYPFCTIPPPDQSERMLEAWELGIIEVSIGDIHGIELFAGCVKFFGDEYWYPLMIESYRPVGTNGTTFVALLKRSLIHSRFEDRPYTITNTHPYLRLMQRALVIMDPFSNWGREVEVVYEAAELYQNPGYWVEVMEGILQVIRFMQGFLAKDQLVTPDFIFTVGESDTSERSPGFTDGRSEAVAALAGMPTRPVTMDLMVSLMQESSQRIRAMPGWWGFMTRSITGR